MAGDTANGKWTNPYFTAIRDRPIRDSFDNLTKYLGGWQDFFADVAWSAGVYTKGNATVKAQYRLLGDICFYSGRYAVGSTTVFPGAGAVMKLVIPFASADDGNGNTYFGGKVYDLSGATSGTPCCFEVTAAFPTQVYVATTKATHDLVTAANPFGWTTLDELRWDFWYRVLV